MRKFLLIATIITVSSACNGKVDEEKINEAGAKLQKTVEKGVDTLGSKLKKLKNKLDDESDTLQK